MVLMDEKNGKIQATMKKTLIKRFVNLLTVCRLIVITNFGVAQNKSNFRTTQHPYKINFFPRTLSMSIKMTYPFLYIILLDK
ncbi:Serendipity locus protein H-1 [Bienertia sinuspersici]